MRKATDTVKQEINAATPLLFCGRHSKGQRQRLKSNEIVTSELRAYGQDWPGEEEEAADPYAAALMAQEELYTIHSATALLQSAGFCLGGASCIKTINYSVSQGKKVTCPSNHSSSDF